jgi:hypothetical protein
MTKENIMHATDERDQAVRALLVDNARRPEARPRRSTALIAAIAFLLGGGLAIGAVSAATAATRTPTFTVPSENDFASMTTGGHTVGPLVSYTGTGGARLDLGPRPKDATGIAYLLQCGGGTGSLAITLGGISQGPGNTCKMGEGFGSSTSRNPADSIVSIRTIGKFTYAVWAKWVAVPPTPAAVAPSAAQDAAIADGRITADELHAAFDRFAACMSTAGFPVTIVSYQPTPTWTDSRDGENYAADYAATTRCAQAELDKVNAIWRAQGDKP